MMTTMTISLGISIQHHPYELKFDIDAYKMLDDRPNVFNEAHKNRFIFRYTQSESENGTQ